jgi:hypothetical protein
MKATLMYLNLRLAKPERCCFYISLYNNVKLQSLSNTHLFTITYKQQGWRLVYGSLASRLGGSKSRG